MFWDCGVLLASCCGRGNRVFSRRCGVPDGPGPVYSSTRDKSGSCAQRADRRACIVVALIRVDTDRRRGPFHSVSGLPEDFMRLLVSNLFDMTQGRGLSGHLRQVWGANFRLLTRNYRRGAERPTSTALVMSYLRAADPRTGQHRIAASCFQCGGGHHIPAPAWEGCLATLSVLLSCSALPAGGCRSSVPLVHLAVALLALVLFAGLWIWGFFFVSFCEGADPRTGFSSAGILIDVLGLLVPCIRSIASRRAPGWCASCQVRWFAIAGANHRIKGPPTGSVLRAGHTVDSVRDGWSRSS